MVAGAVLAVAAGAAESADGGTHSVSLRPEQTRFFVPGAVQAGELVTCGSVETHAPGPPAGNASGGSFGWDKTHTVITIAVQPNGAAEISCTTDGALPPGPRPGTPPYFIGQNGVGLIRGRNSLAALVELYGKPTAAHSGPGCTEVWTAFGLTATFAGSRCTGTSVLERATVTRSPWSSLTQVFVGDTVARLRFEDPTAQLVASSGSGSTWRLARGGASGHAELVARSAGGKITALTAVVG